MTDILIVDDSPEARFARRRTLVGSGFDVREAGSAAEAYAHMAEALPDVVMLDVHLPDANGMQVCRRIKDDPATAHIAVIQISASRVDVAAQVTGLEGGADAYLPEPVHPSVLVATVRAALRERAIAAELRRANAQLGALQRLTNEVSAAVTPDEVLRSVVEAARRAVRGASATLSLTDGELLRIVRATDAGRPRVQTVALGETPTASAVEVLLSAPAPVALGTRAEIEAHFGSAAGSEFFDDVGSLAWTPLRQRGGGRGALGVWGTDAHPYEQADLQTLAAIGDVAVAALERARLFVDEARARALAEAAARRAALRAELLERLELERGRPARAATVAQWCAEHLADAAFVLAADGTVEGRAGRDEDGRFEAALRERIPAIAASRAVEGERWTGGAGLLAALHARGERIGTLALARRSSRPAFGPQEERTVDELVALLGPTLDNARLDDEQRHIARTLQLNLLAGAVGVLPPALSAALRYRPGEAHMDIGGDWHDVLVRDDGRVAVVVGDVVGHGLPATSAMGALRNAARALVRVLPDPSAVLHELDEVAAEQTPMVTVSCVVLEPGSGRLSHASAGHPPPLVVEPRGSARFLTGGRSLPLAGLSPERDEAADELAPGALLLLYSDGLIERRGESLDVGLERLRSAALAAAAHRTLAELADAILNDLLGGAPPEDDVALVVLRRAVRDGDALTRRGAGDPGAQAELAGELAVWLDGQGLPSAVRADVLADARAALQEVGAAHPDELDLEARHDADGLHLAIRSGDVLRPLSFTVPGQAPRT